MLSPLELSYGVLQAFTKPNIRTLSAGYKINCTHTQSHILHPKQGIEKSLNFKFSSKLFSFSDFLSLLTKVFFS